MDNNKEKSCTSGRLYFTTIENIFNFYGNYGFNIRPIKLLPESKTIIENYKIGTNTFEMLPKITFKELIKRYNKSLK